MLGRMRKLLASDATIALAGALLVALLVISLAR
jgi:hypothetical protein